MVRIRDSRNCSLESSTQWFADRTSNGVSRICQPLPSPPEELGGTESIPRSLPCGMWALLAVSTFSMIISHVPGQQCEEQSLKNTVVSFCILPVQRCVTLSAADVILIAFRPPRYLLLLKEVLKYTPVVHSDYKALKVCGLFLSLCVPVMSNYYSSDRTH